MPKSKIQWAVVVTQLEEYLLPHPEAWVQNQPSANFYKGNFVSIEETQNNSKRGQKCPI